MGSERVVLQFDDSHWPDLVIDELESPPLIALLSPDEGEYVAVAAVMGSSVDPPTAPRRTSRPTAPPTRYVPCAARAPSQSGLATSDALSSEGLWLSSSESGYVGVYRDLRDSGSRQLPWRARIYHGVGSGASLVTSPHRALPLPPMPPLEATCWRLASRTVSSLRRIAYTVLRVPRLSRGLPELTNLGATITSGSLPHVRKLSMLIELLRPRVWLSCDRGSLSL